MAPPRCAEYILEEFKGTPVAVKVIDSFDEIEKEFPCAAAVGRACKKVPRHLPRIVRLEYEGKEAEENLFFVGKGITYDTGGADVKYGGNMAGMKRDKGGAATVAGFFRSLGELQPSRVHAVAYLAFVRNSIGSECYVADEVITARSGRRVLVVNTDAEGRMAMADLITKSK
ncbi:lap-2 [Symbiodinium sp. KB8]|nr:lap-2 [Symbiodinium sp. KB8]